MEIGLEFRLKALHTAATAEPWNTHVEEFAREPVLFNYLRDKI